MKSAKSAGMNYWRCPYCDPTKPNGFSYRSHLKNDCPKYSGTPPSGAETWFSSFRWIMLVLIVLFVVLSVLGMVLENLGPVSGSVFFVLFILGGRWVYRRSMSGPDDAD